jgi:hypothetical protein
MIDESGSTARYVSALRRRARADAVDRRRRRRGAPERAVGGRAGEQYKGVRMREFWALPGSTYPNGKHCVWTANGKVCSRRTTRTRGCPT